LKNESLFKMERIMAHGGARKGAGRPPGQGKYKEPTQSIRLPVSRIAEVMQFIDNEEPIHQIPLYSSSVRAGFPSPADDYIERMLDLNEHLIQHPSSTFFVRALGESMINAGIHTGDILVVDRSLPATHGKIVVAAVDGELTVKRLARQGTKTHLVAENPSHPPLVLSPESDVVLWGVVTYVIHGLL
jgi:DNA polymerase V